MPDIDSPEPVPPRPPLRRRVKQKFTKLAVMEGASYEKDWEPVLQTVRVPLAALQSLNPGAGKPFDPARLSVVRLKFDRTATGVICVSGIGFKQEEQ